jgi:hypothetical protein
MELILSLLALLLLAFPIIAVVALVKSVGLREQLRQLEARLAAIERTMSAPAASPVTAAPAPSPPRSPRHRGGSVPPEPGRRRRSARPRRFPRWRGPAAMSLEERLARDGPSGSALQLALGGALVRYPSSSLPGPRVR